MNDINVTSSVQDKLVEFFQSVFGSEEKTEAFLKDPDGAFAAHGLDTCDVQGVDVDQVVYGAASGGGGGGGGYHPSTETVQQVTQVTNQYFDDHSTDVNVFGDGNTVTATTNHAEGDGSVAGNDNEGIATGDGAVAAGDDVENAATGDGAQVIDGDNYGQANTGDNVEQVGGDKVGGDKVYGDKTTADDGAVIAGDDINAPVNTGTNTGIMADGDVENAVVGDHNDTNQVSGSADDANFGTNTGLMGGIDIDTGSGNTTGGTGGAGGTASGGASGAATGGAGAAGGAATAESSGGSGSGGGLLGGGLGGGGGLFGGGDKGGGGSSTATGGDGGSGGAGTSGDGGAGGNASGGSVGDTTGGDSGDVNLNLNFGGSQNAANQSDIDDSAMGQGASNQSDINADDGAAVSQEGDATGSADTDVDLAVPESPELLPAEESFAPPAPEPVEAAAPAPADDPAEAGM